MSEEHKRKIGDANKISRIGMKLTSEHVAKIQASRAWWRPTAATKLKMRLARLANPIRMAKEKHPNWKGGITPLNTKIRTSPVYNEWRRLVFLRDDFTCQACGERGGRLNADHELPFALYPALRFEVLNGRTLCVSCHLKIPKSNDCWKFPEYSK